MPPRVCSARLQSPVLNTHNTAVHRTIGVIEPIDRRRWLFKGMSILDAPRVADVVHFRRSCGLDGRSWGFGESAEKNEGGKTSNTSGMGDAPDPRKSVSAA
ncbi:unnamed protein product, partial [Scytosiphon promiscuus]